MRSKICGIYCITNLANGKKYIGQTVNLKDRWASHISTLNLNNHDNNYLQRSWNKYGEKKFKIEMVFLCCPQDLDSAEIKFIESYKTLNRTYGYNLVDGGHPSRNFQKRDKNTFKRGKDHPLFGRLASQETKDKISKANKGRKLSQEHKIKIGETSKGRFVSEETNLKKVETRRKNGTWHTEETKRKIRETNKGQKRSEETKRKISAKNKLRTGIKNSFYGKKHSEETLRKMREIKIGKKQSKESIQKMVATQKRNRELKILQGSNPLLSYLLD